MPESGKNEKARGLTKLHKDVDEPITLGDLEHYLSQAKKKKGRGMYATCSNRILLKKIDKRPGSPSVCKPFCCSTPAGGLAVTD